MLVYVATVGNKRNGVVMSNIREVLEKIVAPEHPWFDPKKAVDKAELAINKIIEAKFKENYKRLEIEARIDEIKEQIRILNNTLDLIPDDHEYGSGKKHQQVMIMQGLNERLATLRGERDSLAQNKDTK